jgi:hypothetical protein
MDSLSPESKVLYDMLKSDTAEIYEAKFASYKKEMLDAVKVFVDDTNSQIKGITASFDSFHGQVEADLESVKTTLGRDLSAVQHSLSAEIAGLATAVAQVVRIDSGKQTAAEPAVGPDGHRENMYHRGLAGAPCTPPPVGGMPSDRRIFPICPNSQNQFSAVSSTDSTLSGYRAELPQFLVRRRNCGNIAARSTSLAGRRWKQARFRMLPPCSSVLRQFGWNLIFQNLLMLPGPSSP